MSWVMIGITAVSAGLQIGGKLGKNKDAQTAGGLVGLLGGAYGGYSGMAGGAGGTPAIPSGMASSGGMASGVGQAGQPGGLTSMFGQGGSGWKNVGRVGGMLQSMSGQGRTPQAQPPPQPQYAQPAPPQQNPWDWRTNDRSYLSSVGQGNQSENSRVSFQSIFDQMMKRQGFTDL